MLTACFPPYKAGNRYAVHIDPHPCSTAALDGWPSDGTGYRACPRGQDEHIANPRVEDYGPWRPNNVNDRAQDDIGRKTHAPLLLGVVFKDPK